MSDSKDELQVVVNQLNSFMDVLRGRDTGGDDGKFVCPTIMSGVVACFFVSNVGEKMTC